MNKTNQFLFSFLLVEIGVLLVSYSATIVHPVTELVVSEVLSQATWQDQFNKAGWNLVKTQDGDVVLRIHGSEEGKVQLWPNEIVKVDHAIQYINYMSDVEITKVICCYPKRVKKTCTEKVLFICEDCDDCLWSDPKMNAGCTVRVYDRNPN
jgi:hypothetical protein